MPELTHDNPVEFLADEIFDVLQQTAAAMDIHQIAAKVNRSPTTARQALTMLIEEGTAFRVALAKAARGRRQYLYFTSAATD